MGWKGVTMLDQRVRFIAEYLKGYFPFSELCLEFSISRKTGYKWVERYEQEGSAGLADRSRRPHSYPTPRALWPRIPTSGRDETGQGYIRERFFHRPAAEGQRGGATMIQRGGAYQSRRS